MPKVTVTLFKGSGRKKFTGESKDGEDIVSAAERILTSRGFDWSGVKSVHIKSVERFEVDVYA